MLTKLINGREIADAVLLGLSAQVSALGVPVHLAAVCATQDKGLGAFVRIKQRAAQSIGIEFSSYFFAADDERGARQTMEFLAADDSVHGIFVELPLPSSWNSQELLALIPHSKDVDVLTSEAQREFTADRAMVLPPSVRALEYVLEEYAIPTKNLHAAVIGAGGLVGRPVAHWLKRQGARVDIIDIDTEHPEKISQTADLIIAATGSPGLVTADWIHDGATVIDYGYGKRGYEYVGDVDAESVQKKAGLLTPVPGGMGPLVVAAVLENLLTLATR